MEKLFACYFENEGDINDLATLAEIAVAAQLFSTEEAAHKFMKSDELEEEVAKGVQEAYAKGVSGVPHFEVGGEYAFSGAQDEDFFKRVFQKLKLPLLPTPLL